MSVQRDGRERNLDIIGIYHSHIDHPAVPSECDRRLAWSSYSYVIVSVVHGKASDLKSWCLDDQHQFQPEPIQPEPIQPEPIQPESIPIAPLPVELPVP
jgi:proteasome lid subunit RPN8/RPN11